MGGDIDNDYSDGEYAVIWEETTPKARKEYKCCECYGLIKVGEKYAKTSSLYDGRWLSNKVCMDCEKLRVESTVGYTHKPMHGELLTWLFDSVDTIDRQDRLKAYVINTEARGGKIHEWAKEKLK